MDSNTQRFSALKKVTKRFFSYNLLLGIFGLLAAIILSVAFTHWIANKIYILNWSNSSSVFGYQKTDQNNITQSNMTFIQRVQSDLYEGSLTIEQYIAEKGYIHEEHYLTTEDGYILKLIRIQSKNQKSINPFKRPLYLSHGLICSYELWIVNSEDLAPAFVLANSGIDVWLGSFRGTEFALTHAHLDPEKSEFWDFSWEQIATYDLSASV